jgi:hypothetical protein
VNNFSSAQYLIAMARLAVRYRNMEIPPPALKTFDAEGEILEHALAKSLRIRNEAIKSLCFSVRRFRDATIKEECKSDYPHALQALWKALDRAEDLIQSRTDGTGNKD